MGQLLLFVYSASEDKDVCLCVNLCVDSQSLSGQYEFLRQRGGQRIL